MGYLAAGTHVRVVAERLRILRDSQGLLRSQIIHMVSRRGEFALDIDREDVQEFGKSPNHLVEGVCSSELIDGLPLVEALCTRRLDHFPVVRASSAALDSLADELSVDEQLELAAAPVEDANLRRFLRQAFELRQVGCGFFTAPASRANHHAFAGGLAAHSIEVAVLFHRQAVGPVPLPRWQVEVGVVAALLHDVGKLVPPLRQPQIEPVRLRHEAAAIELLRAPLASLAGEAPELADAVEYCLYGHRHHPSESGRLIHCLRSADQFSAATCNESVAEVFGTRLGRHVVLDNSGPAREYFAPTLGNAA
nr:hypothetical protein [Oceanococcus sp. HetDA_MAG_MS8]